ncbi:hypothetical protein, partial [Comamonas thiooxydans]|uniref:hypothetical protein n=1 Tax=Comamonas thiooxydans TaxID=363952 RepID=UPI00055781BE
MKADIKEEKKKRKWDKFSVVLMGGLAVLLLAADMGTYLRAQFLTQRQLSTPEMKDARSAESYDDVPPAAIPISWREVQG